MSVTSTVVPWHLVAVYGTLRKGESNHSVLSRHHHELVETTTLPGFMMYNTGGFPAIVRHPFSCVVVELYSVTSLALVDLDRLEGYRPHNPAASMYLREVVDTDHGPASLYVWNLSTSGLPVIPSGDWKKRNERA